jgi:hypothetical protein
MPRSQTRAAERPDVTPLVSLKQEMPLFPDDTET